MVTSFKYKVTIISQDLIKLRKSVLCFYISKIKITIYNKHQNKMPHKVALKILEL